MRVERDFAGGDGHMMQCMDDVLVRCTLEPCVVLCNNVTPINSILRVLISLLITEKNRQNYRQY